MRLELQVPSRQIPEFIQNDIVVFVKFHAREEHLLCVVYRLLGCIGLHRVRVSVPDLRPVKSRGGAVPRDRNLLGRRGVADGASFHPLGVLIVFHNLSHRCSHTTRQRPLSIHDRAGTVVGSPLVVNDLPQQRFHRGKLTVRKEFSASPLLGNIGLGGSLHLLHEGLQECDHRIRQSVLSEGIRG